MSEANGHTDVRAMDVELNFLPPPPDNPTAEDAAEWLRNHLPDLLLLCRHAASRVNPVAAPGHVSHRLEGDIAEIAYGFSLALEGGAVQFVRYEDADGTAALADLVELVFNVNRADSLEEIGFPVAKSLAQELALRTRTLAREAASNRAQTKAGGGLTREKVARAAERMPEPVQP